MTDQEHELLAELINAAREAAHQLVWLNVHHPYASTAVVYKRINSALTTCDLVFFNNLAAKK